MIVYLDANIIIYVVENHPLWGPKALARIAPLQAAGDPIAIGDASRLECLVGPYMSGDKAILANYNGFFKTPPCWYTRFPLPCVRTLPAFAPRTTSNRWTRCT